VLGKAPTPRVQDLVVETRARTWFVLYFAAVWSGTVLLLIDAPSLFRLPLLPCWLRPADHRRAGAHPPPGRRKDRHPLSQRRAPAAIAGLACPINP